MTSALGLDLFPFPKCPVSASQGDRARARIDRKSFCGNDFRVMARFAPCARRGRLQRVPLRQGAKRGPAPRRNRPTDAGVREPTAESGKRRTTGRGRRAEDRGPRAESRGRTTESGEHKGRRAKGAMRRRLPSPAQRVRGRGECMWHVKRHAASMRTAGEPCGMCSAVKREACPRRLLPRPVLCVGVPSGRFLRLRAFPGHLHSGCVRGTPGATAGVPALRTPDDDVGEGRRLNASNPAISPSCLPREGGFEYPLFRDTGGFDFLSKCAVRRTAGLPRFERKLHAVVNSRCPRRQCSASRRGHRERKRRPASGSTRAILRGREIQAIRRLAVSFSTPSLPRSHPGRTRRGAWWVRGRLCHS